jgi:hypothetical protein
VKRDERIAFSFVFVLLSSSFDFGLVWFGSGSRWLSLLRCVLVLGGFWFWFSYAVRRLLRGVSRVYQ